jgi:hypothetical protein
MTQGNWVVEIGGRMPRIEVAGDICLRRPRPTQGSRADGDVDDDDDDDDDVWWPKVSFDDLVILSFT